MKTHIEEEKFEEIRQLAERAVSAYSKNDAAPYIRRLEFISNSSGYSGSANNILGELVASVKAASGNISDKDSRLYYVRCDLYKLEDFVENTQ